MTDWSSVRSAGEDPGARLRAGLSLLQSGRSSDAVEVFRALTLDWPRWADAHRLLGLAFRDSGAGQSAEASLRASLALDSASGPAAVALSELLLGAGRAEEALEVTAALANRPDADLNILTAHGGALKALGRLEEAREAHERATRAAPASAVAEHNFAAVCGDLEDFVQSETACRRAFAKGLDSPLTWLVQARALLGLGRNDDAREAYEAVLARAPNLVEAHGELAQLIWMMSEDVEAAGERLDQAIVAFPDLQALRLKKAELLQTAGDLDAAYEAVADATVRKDAEPMMHVIAARLSLLRAPERGLRHALEGVRQLPGNPVAQSTLCEAYMALGEIGLAAAIAEAMRRADPLDQHALGMAATVWRLQDDPRYEALYDYDSFVRPTPIETPHGWPRLQDFLAHLTASLARLHTLRTHPVGQSVRLGSQTSQRLTRCADPVVKAFFSAIDGSIRRHIAALGDGEDPLRRRPGLTSSLCPSPCPQSPDDRTVRGE